MKTKCEAMKEFFPNHPVIEEIECMKSMDKALNELWVKARNRAEEIENQIGLKKLDDMVLESLIDDLMMERDARTWAEEAERNFYRDAGL
jgi:DNA-binding ferritin-like protein